MEPYTYPYEHLHHEGPRYNRRGRPGPYQQAALDRLERELQLDEQRIADEMEWEALRGIVPPDY